MYTDEQLRPIILQSVESSFERSKKKVQEMFVKLIPTDHMREGGFAISNKSDFMKGCAVATFYIASNSSLDMALQIQNQPPLSQNLVEYRTKLQEEFSKKLCSYFDVDH